MFYVLTCHYQSLATYKAVHGMRGRTNEEVAELTHFITSLSLYFIY